MSSVTQITDKITAQAKQVADEIAASAAAQSQEILAQADIQAQTLEAEAKKQAQDRVGEVHNRSLSVADLESRKMRLASRQKMIERSFGLALDRLCTMERADYIDLLAGMAVRLIIEQQLDDAEILLNEKDQKEIGEELIKVIQARLGNPEQSGVTKLVEEVAARLLKLSKKEDAVVLSTKTIPARGGFILRTGNVEYNSTMETVVNSYREALVPAVVAALFE